MRYKSWRQALKDFALKAYKGDTRDLDDKANDLIEFLKKNRHPNQTFLDMSKMRTSSLIHHLIFDLSFSDMQIDGAVSADWIKSSLLPVIDQVLEQICVEFGIVGDKVKRIEKNRY
jgi:hypothetical protein